MNIVDSLSVLMQVVVTGLTRLEIPLVPGGADCSSKRQPHAIVPPPAHSMRGIHQTCRYTKDGRDGC